MYQAFVDGMKMNEIFKSLAGRKIFNRKGKPFGQTSINRILGQEKLLKSLESQESIITEYAAEL